MVHWEKHFLSSIVKEFFTQNLPGSFTAVFYLFVCFFVFEYQLNNENWTYKAIFRVLELQTSGLYQGNEEPLQHAYIDVLNKIRTSINLQQALVYAVTKVCTCFGAFAHYKRSDKTRQSHEFFWYPLFFFFSTPLILCILINILQFSRHCVLRFLFPSASCAGKKKITIIKNKINRPSSVVYTASDSSFFLLLPLNLFRLLKRIK